MSTHPQELSFTHIYYGWLHADTGRTSDLHFIGSGFKCHSVLALGKLLTPVCLGHQAVQFGTSQVVVMFCSWEGNHRSGVTVAMCHRLSDILHLWAHDQKKGEEHPVYAQANRFGTIYLKSPDIYVVSHYFQTTVPQFRKDRYNRN